MGVLWDSTSHSRTDPQGLLPSVCSLYHCCARLFFSAMPHKGIFSVFVFHSCFNLLEKRVTAISNNITFLPDISKTFRVFPYNAPGDAVTYCSCWVEIMLKHLVNNCPHHVFPVPWWWSCLIWQCFSNCCCPIWPENLYTMACQPVEMKAKRGLNLNFLPNSRMGDQEYLWEVRRGQQHIRFQLLEVLEVRGQENINK